MNKTIWKFEVPVDDTVQVRMPAGSEVLHMGPTGLPSVLHLWARVDPGAPMQAHTFHVRGTGHPLGQVGAYLGTVEAYPFVWHVFDAQEDPR